MERFEVLQVVEQMHRALREGTHKELAERYRQAHCLTYDQNYLLAQACMMLEMIK